MLGASEIRLSVVIILDVVAIVRIEGEGGIRQIELVAVVFVGVELVSFGFIA